MRRIGVVATLAGCLLAACSAEPGSTSGPAPVVSFDEALEGGATCSELFAIRNELDPNHTAIPTMNERLRAIGCYSSTSERTDV